MSHLYSRIGEVGSVRGRLMLMLVVGGVRLGYVPCFSDYDVYSTCMGVG